MNIEHHAHNSGYILVINPGSTSTKLAIFQYYLKPKTLHLIQQTNLDHTNNVVNTSGPILKQLNMRLDAVEKFIESARITPDLIMARGAPLQPLVGGVYAVDKAMISDLRHARYADHASNLAALIGFRLTEDQKIPVYIADPITTDEFEPLARISGVPGIERKSRSHALNIKASTRNLCQKHEISYRKSRWVVCHMGGGISVAALKYGRIIDVNDALLGMGPFGPERAGALPITGLLDLAYSQNYDRKDLEILLTKKSGLKGYLGTADLREVEDRINSGDTESLLIFQAMVYQISKEIAAMAAVLDFDLDGILLTGGMAHSKLLCNSISKKLHSIARIYVEAGENELAALAESGFRVLLGEETVKKYNSGRVPTA